MTPFEIIIISIIYLICYGFIITMFIKENDSMWLKLLFIIVSLVFAIYAPLIFGEMLYEKLKDK